MTKIIAVIVLARLSLLVFPTEWALHVTGACHCAQRKWCRYGRYWPMLRPDLPTDQQWR